MQTEEWHGNPIDKKGSPVTMHWGFDIVDFIKKHSQLNTKIEYINDLKYGIRAEYIEVLVSKKEYNKIEFEIFGSNKKNFGGV